MFDDKKIIEVLKNKTQLPVESIKHLDPNEENQHVLKSGDWEEIGCMDGVCIKCRWDKDGIWSCVQYDQK